MHLSKSISASNSSLLATLLGELELEQQHASAIITTNRSISYGQLAEQITKKASALQDWKGQLVAVATPDFIEYVSTILALVHVGAHVIPAGQEEQLPTSVPVFTGDQLPENTSVFSLQKEESNGSLVFWNELESKGYLFNQEKLIGHLPFIISGLGIQKSQILFVNQGQRRKALLDWILPGLLAKSCLYYYDLATSIDASLLPANGKGRLNLSLVELKDWLSQEVVLPTSSTQFDLTILDSGRINQFWIEEWSRQYPEVSASQFVFQLPACPIGIAKGKIERAGNFHILQALTLDAPIGKTGIGILDKYNRPTLVNVVGQLHIRSQALQEQVSLAEGQVQLEQIEDNTVATVLNARFQADGKIQLVQKSSRALTLENHSIELDLIEEVLDTHPTVNSSAVIVAELEQNQVLIAFLALQQGANLDSRALRNWLVERLPATKIPSYFAEVEDINTIDVENIRTYNLESGLDLASNEQEQQLLEIWGTLLPGQNIGVNDNFFEAGGHSLLANQMIARIYQHFGKLISIKDVFTYPTIKRLAQFLDDQDTAIFQPIPKIDPALSYEASNAQKRLWVLTKMEEDLVAYNTYIAFKLEGDLDLDAFQEAIHAVVNRHEILRTTFSEELGMPQQIIHKASNFPSCVEIINLKSAPQSEDEIRQTLEAKAAEPFDLEKGPLFRATVYQMGRSTNYLFIAIHHIISDGWSNNIIVKEIVAQYYSILSKTPSPLSELDIHYKDYSAWQLDRLASEEFETHRQFWLDTFSGGIPVLSLPAFKSRPVNKTYNGATLNHWFSKDQLDALYKIGNEEQASLFMTLTALLNVLFYKYSGQEDIILGTATTGRSHPALEEQIGFYLNTLALRNQINPEQTFLEFLKGVKDNTLKAFDHQDYPFDLLVNQLDFDRDASRNPLFDILILLQNFGEDEEGLMKSYFKDLDVELVDLKGKTSIFDMDFEFKEMEEGLLLMLTYNTDVFEAHQIHSLFNHLEVLINNLVKYPQLKIGKQSIITAEERRQHIYEFNDTEKDLPLGLTFHHYLEKFAAKTPNKSVVIREGQRTSYKELNEQANQMARLLVEKEAVQADDLVALIMDRTERTMQTILSIWKAGGAYLPFGRNVPNNRIAGILEDGANVKFIIAERHLIDEAFEQTLRAYCPVYFFEDLQEAALQQSKENLNRYINPDSLAYVIFTSGSTGKPKGVMNEHIGMMNHTLATVDYMELDEHTVFVQNASQSFDISVWQFFTGIVRGGTTLIIGNEVVANPEKLLSDLIRYNATILQVVPSYLGMLLDIIDENPEDYRLALNYLLCCGEALKPRLARRWLDRYPQIKLINDYGPAEASDGTSWFVVDQLPAQVRSVSIGQSIYNMRTYILDEYMNLCPVGVTGEICVAGTGVGRGYLNDDAKTKKVFKRDPFESRTIQRLYKTGDLGRYLPNGFLEYQGRKDYQVKINGQRIELGEIEAKLLSFPEIKASAVIDLEDTSGRKYLCGFIVFQADKEATAEALKKRVGKDLPPYMVPRLLEVLEEMPLTPNGKTDRKKLIRLGSELGAIEQSFLAPASKEEQLLAKAWKTVLGKEQISTIENFYDSGGDSISAIQIASQLYREGYKVEIKDIMRFPTIRELAPMVQPLERVADQEAVSGNIPLTPIQNSFFAASKTNPNHYQMSVLLKGSSQLDTGLMKQTLQKLVEVHDALRITFRWEGDQIIQINQDTDVAIDLVTYDLSDAMDVIGMMNNKAQFLDSSLALDKGPLLKAALFKTPSADYLFITVHHLIIDGVSWRIVLEDLSTIYQQLEKGESINLPLKTDSFKLWAEQLQSYVQTPAFEQERSYWSIFKKLDYTPIPYDFEAAEVPLVKDMVKYSFELNTNFTHQLLTEAHKAYHTEVNDLLITALALSIQQQFGINNQLITLESHGRANIGNISVERTVGWFTSEYPVYLNVDANNDLSTQIKVVKETLHQVPNEGIGYDIIRFEEEDNNWMDWPLPQVVFNYLGQFTEGAQNGPFFMENESLGQLEDSENQSDYPLEIVGMTKGDQLKFNIFYHSTQFKESTIKSWMEAFHQVLKQVVEHCIYLEEQVNTPSDFDYQGLSLDDLEDLENLFS